MGLLFIPAGYFEASSATSASIRRALLTASGVGKAFATSGSRSTKFVPALTLLKCFPRTPPSRAGKSYSSRSSAMFFLSVFVVMAFSLRCWSRADDSDSVLFEFSVRDDDEFAVERPTDCDEPFLSYRVIRIWECPCKRIGEDRRRMWERDAVLALVRFSLVGIPFEDHGFIIPDRLCTGCRTRDRGLSLLNWIASRHRRF